MNFREATEQYETWLREQCEVYEPDLVHKHREMKKNPYKLFRGSYYRWAQLWPSALPELANAPKVLAIGDLHVENFGTWRDTDGRLIWGVNDFDEVDELAYTHDLVRLASSLRLAKTHEGLKLKFGKSCRWILESYREYLEGHGEPFVLEEKHPEIRTLAMAEVREPATFWAKLAEVLTETPVELPADVLGLVHETLPPGPIELNYRRREQVGVGSLGKSRYLLLAEWNGGWIARDAKARTLPSTACANRTTEPSRATELIGRAVRCPDPMYRLSAKWVVRRLAPHCVKIELEDLDEMDELRIAIRAMGAETANIHLGTPAARDAVLKDLASRGEDWLEEAAEKMIEALNRDWQEWQ